MAVNKVIYDGETLMDITDSTVTEETLVEGAVAYNAAGERIVGNASYIPTPASAAVGQTIKVSAVDENGKPTAWEAVDFPAGGETPDEYVVIFNKTFESAVLNTDEWGGESHLYGRYHYWTTDVNGNDVDADYFYFSIHVPAQTEVVSGEIRPRVGYGKPVNWASWVEYQKQPYVGRSAFAEGPEKWAMWEYDLREQALKAAYVANQKFNGNYQASNQQLVTSFPQAVASNGWESFSGIMIELVSGSLPAGTSILVYARKRNPDKVGKRPNWSVAT